MNVLILSELLNDAYFDACVEQFTSHESIACSDCKSAGDFANMLDGCAFE